MTRLLAGNIARFDGGDEEVKDDREANELLEDDEEVLEEVNQTAGNLGVARMNKDKDVDAIRVSSATPFAMPSKGRDENINEDDDAHSEQEYQTKGDDLFME